MTKPPLTTDVFGCCDAKAGREMTLSYECGTSEMPLVAETIGHNLQRTATLHGDRDAVDLGSPGDPLDVPASSMIGSTPSPMACCNAGLRKGERVGIWSPNRAEWPLVQYAGRQGRADPRQRQPLVPRRVSCVMRCGSVDAVWLFAAPEACRR